MQYCFIIFFVFAALVSCLEGAPIKINGSEAGTTTHNVLNELKNKFHVLDGLANVKIWKDSRRVTEVKVTGTEIQVYVEKSRTWNDEDKREQIRYEPLSAPLIVEEKAIVNIDGKYHEVAVKLTPENVREFLRTFGIWRKVHIYKTQPIGLSTLLEENGIQVKNSEQLPALYILFKKL